VLYPGRDVHGVAQDGPPPFVLNGRHRLHDPADLSGPGDDPVLVRGRPAAFQHLDRLRPDCRTVFRVNDVCAPHADHLVDGTSGKKGRLFIQEVETPVENDVDAGVGAAGQGFVELPGLGRFLGLDSRRESSCFRRLQSLRSVVVFVFLFEAAIYSLGKTGFV